MTIRVVDLFKVVNVDHCQGQRPLFAGVNAQFHLEFFHQASSVLNTGQFVNLAQFFELFF